MMDMPELAVHVVAAIGLNLPNDSLVAAESGSTRA